MQFIDFKAEHFSKNEERNEYFIEISKDEIGFGTIEVHKRQDYDSLSEAQYELEEDISKVTIKMKEPADIRVNF